MNASILTTHMFCGLCEERVKRGQIRNTFTTGCGLLRRDSVVKHVKSWHYSDLVSKTKTIPTSSIQSGLKTMEDTEKKRVCTLIGQCFSVAKLDDSLHSFSKRLNHLEHQLQETLGDSYRNNKMAQEFITCLASVGDKIYLHRFERVLGTR